MSRLAASTMQCPRHLQTTKLVGTEVGPSLSDNFSVGFGGLFT